MLFTVLLSYVSYRAQALPTQGQDHLSCNEPTHINQKSGKYPQNMLSGQPDGGYFLAEILSSQICVGFCQVDRNKL